MCLEEGACLCVGSVTAVEQYLFEDRREFFEPRGEVGLRCRDLCVDNGLVMRAVGDTMIVSPPLIFEDAHVDELVEKAWKCLDLTAAALEAAG